MNEKRSATKIAAAGGRQYHLGVAAGEVGPWVIMVGDPARADRVADLLTDIEVRRSHREYVIITGRHEGRRTTVIGTGMGPASTEIAVIELCEIVEFPTVIRCGSTGALQPGVALGDLCISRGCYRMESTSTQFVGEGYPAVADHEVVLALVEAAEARGASHHLGITATAAGFYGAQGRAMPGFPPRDPGVVDRLAREGVLNLEMEASCLLTLASLRGFRAGAVCAAYANRSSDDFIGDEDRKAAEGRCIEVGLSALGNIARMDAERGERPHWHPGLTRA